jgi:hypothetical protein
MWQKLHVASTSSCDVKKRAGVEEKAPTRWLLCNRDLESAAKPRTDVIGEHRAGLGAAVSCPWADDEQLEELHQDENTVVIRRHLPSVVSKCIVPDTAAVVVPLALAAYGEAHFFWYVCYHVIHSFRSATPKGSVNFKTLGRGCGTYT